MPKQAQTRPLGTRAVKFDAEDDAALVAAAKLEKLTVSDIVRRAVREYTRKLGIPNQTKPAA